jgi:very-short-patch-repair endonuclease
LGETGEGFRITDMVKNIIPGQRVTKEKLNRARELRSEMTPAEKILWQEVRANKLGVHFRRQQIIAGFIVDFYCHSAGLVIELDGEIHLKQKQDDSEREKALKEMGLSVVRFQNEEVTKDLLKVVNKIRVSLQKAETATAKNASQ